MLASSLSPQQYVSSTLDRWSSAVVDSPRTDGIWAAYWGLFYRKFFWDFIGSTLRNPGGAQYVNRSLPWLIKLVINFQCLYHLNEYRPGPNVAPFITVIVKVPVVQIFAMLLGFFILALEWPLPLMKKLPIYRNIVVRMVLLFFQTFLNILFYQASRHGCFDVAWVSHYYIRERMLQSGHC